MVGDRDRPEAAVAGRLQQHVDRGRAVAGVVGVHVQVDLDQRPLGDPLAQLRVAASGRGGGPAAGGRSLPARRRPAPVARRRAARLDQLVGGREVALEQLRRSPAGHRAGVDPAEEDLDQRPRHLGREHPLLRRVEGGDVERVGVAQRRRGRRSARTARGRGRCPSAPRFQQPLDRVAGRDPQHLVAAPLQLGRRRGRRTAAPGSSTPRRKGATWAIESGSGATSSSIRARARRALTSCGSAAALGRGRARRLRRGPGAPCRARWRR